MNLSRFWAWRGQRYGGRAGWYCAIRLESSLSFCALFPHPLAVSFVSCAVGNHSLLYMYTQSICSLSLSLSLTLSLSLPFSVAFLPSCPFFVIRLKRFSFCLILIGLKGFCCCPCSQCKFIAESHSKAFALTYPRTIHVSSIRFA